MRLLLTGGTGFIGGHLVDLLADTDHEVVCLARRGSDTSRIERCGFPIRFGDVTDRRSVAEAMAGCDSVVNLANVYSMWERDKRVFQRVNVEGTRNVLGCALEAGAAKAVHVSTAAVYGVPKDRPFKEDSEPGPKRFSEYARTKYEAELVAWELFEKGGLPLVVISPGAVLGPGDTKPTGAYMRDLAARRMPAGVCRDVVMTYVHVRDVAWAIVLALERDGVIGEKYLIGAERLTFGELTEMICEEAGVPPPRIYLPGPLVSLTALLLTALAAVTGRPPARGFSRDQASMARRGFAFDGGKAERELGLRYTPVRTAVAEAVAALREGSASVR